MSATIRFKPLAIIYAAGTAFLSTKGYTNVAQPNASTSAIYDTVVRLNAAITEINTYYQSYGYATSPNLPQLPSVPTGANALVYQALGSADAGVSLAPVDGAQTSGGPTPSSALERLLTEPALANIVLSRANLDAGRS